MIDAPIILNNYSVFAFAMHKLYFIGSSCGMKVDAFQTKKCRYAYVKHTKQFVFVFLSQRAPCGVSFGLRKVNMRFVAFERSLYSNTELIGLLFDVYTHEYFNTSNNTPNRSILFHIATITVNNAVSFPSQHSCQHSFEILIEVMSMNRIRAEISLTT